MKNFGARLTKLREERGLSLEQLAKELKFTEISLSLWENNQNALSINNLIKISKYFGVSVDYLVGL